MTTPSKHAFDWKAVLKMPTIIDILCVVFFPVVLLCCIIKLLYEDYKSARGNS